MTPLAVVELARKLIGLILELVPVDAAKALLSEEAIRRQNAVADGAEVVKFAVAPALEDMEDD